LFHLHNSLLAEAFLITFLISNSSYHLKIKGYENYDA
jgi:hypothetical protein